jgi:hypothetical protein
MKLDGSVQQRQKLEALRCQGLHSLGASGACGSLCGGGHWRPGPRGPCRCSVSLRFWVSSRLKATGVSSRRTLDGSEPETRVVGQPSPSLCSGGDPRWIAASAAPGCNKALAVAVSGSGPLPVWLPRCSCNKTIGRCEHQATFASLSPPSPSIALHLFGWPWECDIAGQ